MKTSKITKLLPVMLALMLMAPSAFAEPKSATSTMNLTVPQFINITKDAEQPKSGVTLDDKYTTLSVTTPMTAQFGVVTNTPNRVIELDAKSPVSGGSPETLYGESATAMKIVFTNSTRQPQTTDVTNITQEEPAPGSNKNAIAFALKANITPGPGSGATEPEKAFAGQKAQYTLQNGTYTFLYTVQGEALPNTFSTHDTNGLYQATITMTDLGDI